MLQALRRRIQLTLTNIIAGHQRKGQVEEARCRYRILAKTARMRHPEIPHRPKSPPPNFKNHSKLGPPASGKAKKNTSKNRSSDFQDGNSTRLAVVHSWRRPINANVHLSK
jgi:hypothetical protein